MRDLGYRSKIFIFSALMMVSVLLLSFLLVMNVSSNRVIERTREDVVLSERIIQLYIDELAAEMLLASELTTNNPVVQRAFRERDHDGRVTVMETLTRHSQADWGVFFHQDTGYVVPTALVPDDVRQLDTLTALVSAFQTDEGNDNTIFGVTDIAGAHLLTLSFIGPRENNRFLVLGRALDNLTLDTIAERLPINTQLSVYLPKPSALYASQLPKETHTDITALLSSMRPPALTRVAGVDPKEAAVGSERAEIGGKGYEIMVSRLPLLNTLDGALLVVASSLDSVDAENRELALNMAVMLLIALMISGICAVYFADRVSQPLVALAATAKEVEQGRYPRVPALERRDEVGSLASSLQMMIRRVQNREQRLAYQVSHDAETGLYNRSEVTKHMKRLVGGMVIVVKIDILEKLGYTLGRKLTTDVMMKLATVLMTVAGKSGVAARLNTDLFAIVLPAGHGSPIMEMKRIQQMLFDTPLRADLYDIDITGTIASADLDVMSAAGTCIDRAEAALFRARSTGQKLAIYDPDYDEPNLDTLTLMSDMRKGLERGDIQLYVQPKMDLASGKIVEVEALVRWFHRERGFIPPDVFIPVCEQTGRISLLTAWVCEEAARIYSKWCDVGCCLQIAVNLSAQDLMDRDLPANLERALSKTGISSRDLRLEVTESAVMGDAKLAIQTMETLSRHGFSLAIDDFGTGYSSLEYLLRLPAKEVKIDRTFVMDMDQKPDNQAVVRAAIQMAHGLGMIVTAEGVENAETLQMLREMGCDKAQGYFIGRPVPLSEFTRHMSESPDQFAFGCVDGGRQCTPSHAVVG